MDCSDRSGEGDVGESDRKWMGRKLRRLGLERCLRAASVRRRGSVYVNGFACSVGVVLEGGREYGKDGDKERDDCFLDCVCIEDGEDRENEGIDRFDASCDEGLALIIVGDIVRRDSILGDIIGCV